MDSKKRKAKIINYLKKNPLSGIREIMHNADERQIRFSVVKNKIEELIKEGRIDYLYSTRSKSKTKEITRSYYVTPKKGREKSTLWKIIGSKKILLLPRLWTITYKDTPGTWTFPQLVRNFIALFHLQFKIFSIKKGKSETEFKNKFLKFWKSVVKDQPSFDDFLELMTILVANYHYLYKIYFDSLKVGKFSSKKRLKIMKDVLDDDLKGASLRYVPKKYEFMIKKIKKSRTTPKYIRNKLKPITDEKGKLSWLKVQDILEEEEGWLAAGYDPEFVKLLVKSGASNKEILDYMATVTGWYNKKDMKDLIFETTGILLSF